LIAQTEQLRPFNPRIFQTRKVLAKRHLFDAFAIEYDKQRPTLDQCRALRAMKFRALYACWAPGYACTASVRERPRLSS
jgi:hypothetical protein